MACRLLTVIMIWPLTFDCVRGTGPVYLIHPVSDLSRRSLRSADCGDLFISRANTSIGPRSFSVAAPVVWNTLPPDLCSPLNSRRQFQSKLKTHLFRQAYNTAWFLWEQFVGEWNSVTVTNWPLTQSDLPGQMIHRLGQAESIQGWVQIFKSTQQPRLSSKRLMALLLVSYGNSSLHSGEVWNSWCWKVVMEIQQETSWAGWAWNSSERMGWAKKSMCWSQA